MTIVIVDTSILLNILDIPGKNQQREEIRNEFRRLLRKERSELILPLVAVVEAGNHIAQLADGRLRRARGNSLVEVARQALRKKAPWVLAPFPEPEDLEGLLQALPDQLNGGLGFADASIMVIWERERNRWPERRVRIWSLDRQLQAYDHEP